MNAKEIMPLRSGEATELQLLWACSHIMDTCSERLEKRIRLISRWPQFRTIQKWLSSITNEIMTTMDEKRAKTFLLNLMNQEIRVVSKSTIQTHPDYTLIPSRTLSCIIAQAMTDTCMLCNGDGCDMAKCRFRKELKQTMMFDIDESGGVCMGKTLLAKMERED